MPILAFYTFILKCKFSPVRERQRLYMIGTVLPVAVHSHSLPRLLRRELFCLFC